MITYTAAKTDTDLLQILTLQQSNLTANITVETIQSQGFVTVKHSFEDLHKMNGFEKSIVAKDGETVVAYALAMTEKSKMDIPVLMPMFELFDNLSYNGKKISDSSYIVVGQVCVADGYRGQGIFDNLYQAYKNHFQEKRDFAITEISARNQRSLNAHKRVGFKSIQEHLAPNGENWHVVLWDWNKRAVSNKL